jgi:hypothetical protein
MPRRPEWVESHLDDLKADFPFLLEASFADPDHPGANTNLRLMFEDNLDNLAATKVEISPKPEAFGGQIDEDAWDPIRAAV